MPSRSPAAKTNPSWRAGNEPTISCSPSPGYRSSQLHKSTETSADFRYVNVAVWDSEDAFRAATSRPEFRDISTEYPFHSSVYEVVSADQRWTLPSTRHS